MQVDPVEVLKRTRIAKAERRREEWIEHQIASFQDQKIELIYRKGVQSGANSTLYDHRFDQIDGLRKKSFTPF